MEFKIAENKIYLENQDGKEVALIQFKRADDGVLIADKTFVDDSLRGQGIAAKLVEELVAYARQNNNKIHHNSSYKYNLKKVGLNPPFLFVKNKHFCLYLSSFLLII